MISRFSLVMVLLTTSLTACVNSSVITHDATIVPVSNNGQSKELYSYHKYFIQSPIKYRNYEELDGKGRTLPSDAIGVVGRFYISEEDGCLILFSEDSTKVATPILNYKYTQWDAQTKTLILGGTYVKIGQLVLVNGGIEETPPAYQGSCLDRGYIVDMNSFGVKLIPESDLHLYKQKF